MKAMKAMEAMHSAAERLTALGIPDPEKEAELIITAGLGVDRVSLYRDDPALGWEDPGILDKMLRRREKREPIQYILGEVEFYGLMIRVGPGVLIPRPETELLVEEALKRLSDNPSPRVLELCTGSGCVALAVAKNLPGSTVMATENSKEALGYAYENASLNGVENAAFLRGSLFEPVVGQTFDAVLSNPPYIRTGDIDTLAPEIRNWEPREALDGGPDGLDFYREIIPGAKEHLKPGGALIVEMGAALAPEVAKIAEKAGLKPLPPLQDWGGCDRVMTITA
jgi:release factor glutamine methyltransferase